MTLAEILQIPTDQLPYALYTAGLAPAGLTPSPTITGEYYTIWAWRWVPHTSWDDAAPLLERFGLMLSPWDGHAPYWVVETLSTPYCVPFAQVPEYICRLALIIQATQEPAPWCSMCGEVRPLVSGGSLCATCDTATTPPEEEASPPC